MVIIMTMSSASYAYREVAKGSLTSSGTTESITVYDSKENLESALAALYISGLEAIDSIDFSKESVVLIVASACPNPGYSIAAEAVGFEKDEVNVKYKTIPGPSGMMYAQVISYPWLLVAVEKR
jgi:hypothetical protein